MKHYRLAPWKNPRALFLSFAFPALILTSISIWPLATNTNFGRNTPTSGEGSALSVPAPGGDAWSAHKPHPGEPTLARGPAPLQTRDWGLKAVNATEAWKLIENENEPEKREIVVAVIDTGADITHPDLRDHLWTNPGESGKDDRGRDKATNGIDDDGNGLVDDVHGWNFATEDADLTDMHGHGTHIAGIVRGVAPNAKIMVLKYFDPTVSGTNPLASTITAFEYATRMGAKIINYSAGGPRPNRLELEVLRLAETFGVLVVAAAGNEASNSDRQAYYPADYDLPNILSVTATDPWRKILPTSNYGKRSVDIAAPGEAILSSVPGGFRATMTGTSQATAFATGAAALLLSQRPDLTDPAEVIDQLVLSGEHVGALAGKTREQTVLNTYRALALQDRGTSASGIKARNTEGLDEIFTLDGPTVKPETMTP